MLYKQNNRRPVALFFRGIVAAIAASLASVARRRSDARWLDGVPDSRLEDLGLRRSDDGHYRFFD